MTNDELKAIEKAFHIYPDIQRLVADYRGVLEVLKVYAHMQDWGYGHDSNGDCDFGVAARKELGEK
jgi:hypothetical protein